MIPGIGSELSTFSVAKPFVDSSAATDAVVDVDSSPSVVVCIVVTEEVGDVRIGVDSEEADVIKTLSEAGDFEDFGELLKSNIVKFCI